MVPLSETRSIDLWPGFQGHDIFWSRVSEKRLVLGITSQQLWETYTGCQSSTASPSKSQLWCTKLFIVAIHRTWLTSSRSAQPTPHHYDQSSRDTENSDPVQKTGFLCLRSRRVEQSSSICPHRRLVLPPCSQNSSVPVCF